MVNPMIDRNKLNALQKIYRGLDDLHVVWAVTGSLGMALQGMDIEVRDIDIQTSRDGAFEIESCFQQHVVEPVRYLASERKRSYLGALEIDGIKVEIMGDVQALVDGDVWEEPVKVERYRRWIDLDELQIPVLSLEHEMVAYQAMGRNERAQQITQWLDASG